MWSTMYLLYDQKSYMLILQGVGRVHYCDTWYGGGGAGKICNNNTNLVENGASTIMEEDI